MRNRWSLRWGIVAAALCMAVATTACDRSAVQLDETMAAEGNAWDIRATTDRSGEEPMLVLEVEPRPPYRINTEFPWMLGVPTLGAELRTPDAVTFDEERVVFRLPAGTAREEVEGRLRFSVCTDDVCLTPRQSVNWTLAEAGEP